MREAFFGLLFVLRALIAVFCIVEFLLLLLGAHVFLKHLFFLFSRQRLQYLVLGVDQRIHLLLHVVVQALAGDRDVLHHFGEFLLLLLCFLLILLLLGLGLVQKHVVEIEFHVVLQSVEYIKHLEAQVEFLEGHCGTQLNAHLLYVFFDFGLALLAVLNQLISLVHEKLVRSRAKLPQHVQQPLVVLYLVNKVVPLCFLRQFSTDNFFLQQLSELNPLLSLRGLANLPLLLVVFSVLSSKNRFNLVLVLVLLLFS